MTFSIKEVTDFIPKKITVSQELKKLSNLAKCHMNLQKPMKKVTFQTISWGGSRYLKVVNPFVWCQSE